jgi:hypothetical protein
LKSRHSTPLLALPIQGSPNMPLLHGICPFPIERLLVESLAIARTSGDAITVWQALFGLGWVSLEAHVARHGRAAASSRGYVDRTGQGIDDTDQ